MDRHDDAGRGGEGARAMDRHDDALTHRSCCPTPPLNLQVNNQLRGRAGRTRCPTVRPASTVREGGWEEEGARAMGVRNDEGVGGGGRRRRRRLEWKEDEMEEEKRQHKEGG
jgi:hypothetical protein